MGSEMCIRDRSDRVAKYNQLLRISENDKIQGYAGELSEVFKS